MTPAAEAYVQMHEWYTGMREAGFTMVEAATIIATIIARSSEGGTSPDGPS
jgi:hypothetical protein